MVNQNGHLKMVHSLVGSLSFSSVHSLARYHPPPILYTRVALSHLNRRLYAMLSTLSGSLMVCFCDILVCLVNRTKGQAKGC
jgi:hypothetical protein